MGIFRAINENEKDELLKILDQIKDQIQKSFSSPLVIGNYKPSDDLKMNYFGYRLPYYYIAEVMTARFLSIFPYRKQRIFFVITAGFHEELSGEKEIYYKTSESNILSIVRKELKEYARKVGATRVKHLEWTD